MIKKQIILLIDVIIIIAGGVNAKTEQYVALTGGTNGFGAKYTCAFSFMSLDFGLPMLIWSETKEKDGLKEDISEMQFNPYLSANVQVFKKARSSVNVGVIWEENIKHKSYTLTVDTSSEKKKTERGFTSVSNIGPIFEYIQRGKDLNKLFGAQIFPIVINKLTKKDFNFKIAIQLNYFIRKIRPID